MESERTGKMSTPVQIHIGGDTGIPEKFWEHVRKTLATDDYPVFSLYDDGQEHYADVAEKGINHQYNSYLDAGGITSEGRAGSAQVGEGVPLPLRRRARPSNRIDPR